MPTTRIGYPAGGGGAATLTIKRTVADQAARFALTTDEATGVQTGDYVKQTDTGALYLVIDDTQLGSSAGYEAVATNDAATLTTGTLDAARLPSGISPTKLSTTATDKVLGRSTSGGGAVEEISCTATGRSLLACASVGAVRTALSLVPGTDVQAYDADLTALAGVTSAADKVPYFTGSGTADVMTVTSAARSVLDDTTTAAMLATLGAAPVAGVSGAWAIAGALTGATTIAASSTVTAGGDVILTGSTPTIRTTTVDGADNKSVILAPSGAAGVARGGYHYACGNEAGGGQDGEVGSVIGDIGSAKWRVLCNNGELLSISNLGNVAIDSTVASNWRQKMPHLGAAAYRTTDQTGLAATTYNKLLFPTERFDVQNAFASSTYTAPRAGYVRIRLNIAYYIDGPARAYFFVYKNGSRVVTSARRVDFQDASYTQAHYACWEFATAANDTWEIYEWHASGTAAVKGIEGETGNNDTGITEAFFDVIGA